MPELPEVEVTRLGLRPHLEGQRIRTIRWSGKKLRTPMPRKLLKEHVEGKVAMVIDRRAKYLLFRLQGGGVLVIHLGMTGKLGIFPARTSLAKHDHLCLTLDSGMEVRLNDSRRFGAVAVWPPKTAQEQEIEFSAREGIEPFSKTFSKEELTRLAQKRTLAVKSFLMNGKLIAGIGNIYANEILYSARVHPLTPAVTLKPSDWHRIVEASREILTRAIAAGGSTISDFIGSSGNPGYFQLQLSVYDKAGTPCPACSRPIEKSVIGGRATYLCLNCQPP